MAVYLETPTLISAYSQVKPSVTFLRDRYFPTNPLDVSESEEVVVEYKDGTRKIAPLITPYSDGIYVERNKVKQKEVEPARILLKRRLRARDVANPIYGENSNTPLTAEERKLATIMEDMLELDAMISDLEESMSGQLLVDNGYEFAEYSDNYGNVDKAKKFKMQFYDGETNPQSYMPAVSWSNLANADIFGDLQNMCNTLAQHGISASDCVMSLGAAKAMLTNDKVYAALDNHNYHLGTVFPSDLTNGASFLGNLNVFGINLNLITYAATYTDETGVVKPFIPDGSIVVTRPNCGKMLYGKVTLIDKNDIYQEFSARRVPWIVGNQHQNSLDFQLHSKPLAIPTTTFGWISATVIF
jgi:hypothetical protein